MDNIIQISEKYVREQFSSTKQNGLIYHNMSHNIEVIDTVREMISEINLSSEDQEKLFIAAWFHDVGYIDNYQDHEIRSAEICSRFLQDYNYPADKAGEIINMILATRIPQAPSTYLEELLCDADLSHTGRKGFYPRSLLLKEEWENYREIKYSEKEWIETNIDFLQSITYFTPIARNKFTQQKNKNFEKLKKRLSEMKNSETETTAEETEIPKKKDKQVDRGIETMFRNTIRTHVEFSIMADNKANIMISVNTLILTAIVAVMSRKLDSNPHLIIPTALLTFISLATLIFATLVTRPKITSGRFSEEEIKQKKANLLFFGNFFNMDLKMFQWGMNEMMQDKEYLYGSMIKDFYYLGQVLGQKYKYLRICYNLFMYGIILTVLAFAIAVAITPEGTNIGPLIE